MSRGEINWFITIPEDGRLPVREGALIQWQTESHPATTLKEYGLSLSKLKIFHPEQKRMKNLLGSLNLKGNIKVSKGSITKIVAYIDTPQGVRALHA